VGLTRRKQYRAQGGENVAQLLGVWDEKPDMKDMLSIRAFEAGAPKPAQIWGADAPAIIGLDEAVDQHCGKLHWLYKEFLKMGEMALGCEPGYFDAFHGGENSTLQISNYFQDLAEDEHRFGAHTDSAMLSILRTDVPGPRFHCTFRAFQQEKVGFTADFCTNSRTQN